MLSGVGDAEHLKEVGIPVVQHMPAVGQNMEDHLDLYIQYKCTKPITLHNATWYARCRRSPRRRDHCIDSCLRLNHRKYPQNMVKIGLEWFLRQTGMAASAHLEAGGFIRRFVAIRCIFSLCTLLSSHLMV
jgi:choline dehydrogenase